MTTTDSVPASETFLRGYHDRTPGSMADSVLARRLPDGRTAYELLADRVAGAQRVLDLGCADGLLLAVLARDGASGLAGIDLSDGELELARQRPELVDADLRTGRAQALPFADNSFDAVVSQMAFMLMEDVEQVVAEAARVLTPGGKLAIAVGAGTAPGGALELFLKVVRPAFAALPPERSVPLMGDRRARSRKGLDGLLSPAGFEPVTWEELTLELRGTPEEVWEASVPSYYNMASLDEEQVAVLRKEFVALASRLSLAQWRKGGARISVATSRLAGA
jgi:ubiquinone/menaquinone biosynthesis C-methylase UbiE